MEPKTQPKSETPIERAPELALVCEITPGAAEKGFAHVFFDSNQYKSMTVRQFIDAALRQAPIDDMQKGNQELVKREWNNQAEIYVGQKLIQPHDSIETLIAAAEVETHPGGEQFKHLRINVVRPQHGGYRSTC